MENGIAFGTIGLDDKDLVLIKSALKLRIEKWNWTAGAGQAALLVVDPAHPEAVKALSRADDGKLYVLVGGEAEARPSLESIGKPIKAVQFMRALDRLLARNAPPRTSPAGDAVPLPATAAAEAAHPWEGRRIMLLRAPSYSKYPVTAEMLGYIEALCRGPVPYLALVRALPLDRPLLDAMLNEAARNGFLVDAQGTALPVHEGKKSGLVGRLLGKS